MNKIITEFGKTCRKLRIDKGLTMDEAAEMLGCSQPSLSYIEQGKTNPSIKFFEKFFKVFEIPESDKIKYFTESIASQKKLSINLEEITMVSKETLAKLMAVLIYNIKNPEAISDDMDAVYKAIENLNPVYRKGQFTALQSGSK